MKTDKKQEKGKVGLILIDKDNKIVLQLRDNSSKIKYPNCIGTFGGAIEENETAEQAIIRELKEEIDYDLKDFSYIGNFPFEDYRIFMFLKKDKNLDSSKLKVREGQGIALIDKNNLENNGHNFAFNCKEIIKHYLSSI